MSIKFQTNSDGLFVVNSRRRWRACGPIEPLAIRHDIYKENFGLIVRLENQFLHKLVLLDLPAESYQLGCRSFLGRLAYMGFDGPREFRGEEALSRFLQSAQPALRLIAFHASMQSKESWEALRAVKAMKKATGPEPLPVVEYLESLKEETRNPVFYWRKLRVAEI